MAPINLKRVGASRCTYATWPSISFPLFFPLKPYGWKTGEIEALSSYMCRQAELLSEWPLPMTERVLNDSYSATGARPYTRQAARDMYACNSTRLLAQRLVAKMNALLDGAYDTQYLTMVPLVSLTDRNSRGLCSSHKAWCPQCWREDIAVGRTPYLRLYWAMDQVSICCVHNCRLSEYCPGCGEINYQFPRISRQWHCDKCGADLTNESIDDKIDNFSSEEGWVSHSAYQLIERVYATKQPITARTISKALKQLLKTHELTAHQYARRLNINVKMAKGLLAETHRPYFPSFLDMCYRLNIPPDQFLFSRDILTDKDLWLDIDKKIFVNSSKISDKERKKIRSALNQVIRQNPTPPVRVSHLARKYSTRHTALQYNFPEEYRILRRRWVQWESQNRTSAHTARLESLCESVFNLARNGIYPSDRKLRALELVKPSDLRREDVKSLLRTLQEIYADLADDTGG